MTKKRRTAHFGLTFIVTAASGVGTIGCNQPTRPDVAAPVADVPPPVQSCTVPSTTTCNEVPDLITAAEAEVRSQPEGHAGRACVLRRLAALWAKRNTCGDPGAAERHASFQAQRDALVEAKSVTDESADDGASTLLEINRRLTTVLWDLGEFGPAIVCDTAYVDALAARRGGGVANALRGLMFRLRETHRHEELAIRVKQLEGIPGSGMDVPSLVALGYAYLELQDADAAEADFNTARAIMVSGGNASLRLYVRATSGIGMVKHGRTEFGLAIRYFREALKRIEQAEDDGVHVPVLSAYVRANLGESCIEIPDFDCADRQLKMAYDIRVKSLGAQAANTLKVLIMRSKVRRMQGRYEEAKDFAARAREGLEASLGMSHRLTALALMEESNVACSMSDCETCMRLVRRSLKIAFETYGRTSIEYVKACGDALHLALACRHVDPSMFRDRLRDAKEAIKFLQGTTSESDVRLLVARLNLIEAGRDAAARAREFEAIEPEFVERFGEDSVRVADIRSRRVALMVASEKGDEAGRLCRQAIRDLSRVYDRHPIMAELLLLRQRLRAASGDVQGGQKDAEAAYCICAQRYGLQSKKTQELAERFGLDASVCGP